VRCSALDAGSVDASRRLGRPTRLDPDNSAMIGAATQVGFAREGSLRRSAWVNGDFADETILGLLACEWDAN
jgi:RimJ/RimL family protein N-acetyltransferase